ncbi:MAG: hypothetical protein AAGC55_26595, partial [Myxococcota bacterium]
QPGRLRRGRVVLVDGRNSAMVYTMDGNTHPGLRPPTERGLMDSGRDGRSGALLTTALAHLIALPAAALISFLPAPLRRRWRHSLPLTAGTAVSAAVQIALSGLWAMVAYRSYLDGAGSHSMLLGAAHFTGFLAATPAGWLALYGAAEGLVRLASAVAAGEALGTLPLALAWRVATAAAGRSGQRGGQLCRDIAVIRPDGSLIIHTCRARSWSALTTIEYRGQFYRIAGSRQLSSPADAQRPHVYELAPTGDGDLIRQLHRYSPNELL